MLSLAEWLAGIKPGTMNSAVVLAQDSNRECPLWRTVLRFPRYTVSEWSFDCLERNVPTLRGPL